MAKARISSLTVLGLVAWAIAACQADVLDVTLPTPSPTTVVLASPTPSSTPQPTTVPPASPTPVPLPPRPDDFGEYALTIVEYLNDSWGALRQVTDLLRVDVDDDGAGEILAVVVDPSPEYGINPRGDLLVIDRDGERFTVAYSASGDSILMDPALLEVGDLNGDGHTEMAFSSTSCGAHTCSLTVHVASSGTGTFEDLTGGGIDMSYAQASFTDWDGDGVPDLVMHGGTIGSVGAGPQRERTECYKWDGGSYVFSETVYDPSNYLYFKVLDANQALGDGEHERAALLYREAIDDDTLQIWMEEREREDLAAFSRYRLSLTYLLLGEVSLAQAARDELLIEQPDSVYAQVVTVLWDAYQRETNLRTACDEVGVFAALNPQVAEVLADYGYGNPTFTPEEVCPIDLF
jgi:hypothetical protein